jgi:competence protein ComEA
MLKKLTSRERVFALFAVILVFLLVSIWYAFSKNSMQSVGFQYEIGDQSLRVNLQQDPSLANNERLQQDNEKPLRLFYVDLKGAIVTPGVYRLEEGARVVDAIGAAGGLTEDGSTAYINLALRVTDGMVIYVPTQEEMNQGEQWMNKGFDTALLIEGESGKININTASASQLEMLSGIGPERAKAIVQYRQQQGAFSSADELLNVSGIGPATLERIREDIIY